MGLKWLTYQGSKMNRWSLIEASMSAEELRRTDNVYVLDIGANEGFFSLHFARLWDRARVVSIERDHVHSQPHRIHALELGVEAGSYLCETHTGGDELDALYRTTARWDYQLALSVLHWFKFSHDQKSFCRHIVQLVTRARATFIELPLIVGDTAMLGSWFHVPGMTEAKALEGCLATGNVRATVRVLGKEKVDGDSGAAKERNVLRVDNLDHTPRPPGFTFPCSAVQKALHCPHAAPHGFCDEPSVVDILANPRRSRGMLRAAPSSKTASFGGVVLVVLASGGLLMWMRRRPATRPRED